MHQAFVSLFHIRCSHILTVVFPATCFFKCTSQWTRIETQQQHHFHIRTVCIQGFRLPRLSSFPTNRVSKVESEVDKFTYRESDRRRSFPNSGSIVSIRIPKRICASAPKPALFGHQTGIFVGSIISGPPHTRSFGELRDRVHFNLGECFSLIVFLHLLRLILHSLSSTDTAVLRLRFLITVSVTLKLRYRHLFFWTLLRPREPRMSHIIRTDIP